MRRALYRFSTTVQKQPRRAESQNYLSKRTRNQNSLYMTSNFYQNPQAATWRKKRHFLEDFGMNYMGPEAARSGARMLAPPQSTLRPSPHDCGLVGAGEKPQPARIYPWEWAGEMRKSWDEFQTISAARETTSRGTKISEQTKQVCLKKGVKVEEPQTTVEQQTTRKIIKP